MTQLPAERGINLLRVKAACFAAEVIQNFLGPPALGALLKDRNESAQLKNMAGVLGSTSCLKSAHPVNKGELCYDI